MAFIYAGNLISNKPAVIQRFQTGAAVYVGQPVEEDYANLYGHVITLAAAAAAPDTTVNIMGVCVGIVNDPLYSATYKAEYNTYDSTLAAVVANAHKDASMIEVAIARPGDMYEVPIVKDTIGTALDVVTNTTTEAAGTTLTMAAGTDYQLGYATMHCRSGNNKGLERIVTTSSTTVKTCNTPFPYAIVSGDTFVIAAVKLGRFMLVPDSLFMAIDGDVATGGNYYNAWCHKMDLSTAGAEKAWISFHPFHCWYNTVP